MGKKIKSKETTAQKARRNRLLKLFRVTPEEVAQIEEFQKADPVFKVLLGRRKSLDHDHKTGLIRGLLEWRINRAYGLIEKVDPKNCATILRALADFHDCPPATTVLEGKRYGLIGKAQYKKKMVYGPPKSK